MSKSKLGITIRMGASRFDIKRGDGDLIDLSKMGVKDTQEASDILVGFLKGKGFFSRV